MMNSNSFDTVDAQELKTFSNKGLKELLGSIWCFEIFDEYVFPPHTLKRTHSIIDSLSYEFKPERNEYYFLARIAFYPEYKILYFYKINNENEQSINIMWNLKIYNDRELSPPGIVHFNFEPNSYNLNYISIANKMTPEIIDIISISPLLKSNLDKLNLVKQKELLEKIKNIPEFNELSHNICIDITKHYKICKYYPIHYYTLKAYNYFHPIMDMCIDGICICGL
jgi:hypothetical protein